MKMCNMERHQMTNETKQTGFRAGFFPGLIGINCERLQSTARRLTFASSERFLLIVLMITTGAGDHCRAGNGLPGAWPELLPGAWLACAYLGPWGPTFPCYLLQDAGPGPWTSGPLHGAWLLAPTLLPACKVDGEAHGFSDPGCRPGSYLAGLALTLEHLSFLILLGGRKAPTNAGNYFLAG